MPILVKLLINDILNLAYFPIVYVTSYIIKGAVNSHTTCGESTVPSLPTSPVSLTRKFFGSQLNLNSNVMRKQVEYIVINLDNGPQS